MLPVLFALISVEVLLQQIPNDYKYKASYLNKNAENIIALGSSHTYFWGNPVFFKKKAFNMGHVSQILDYDFLLFDKYKDRFEKLEAVYIHIAYVSLWSRLCEGIDKWRCDLYFDSYGFTKNIKINDIVLSKGTVARKIIKIIRYVFNGKNDVHCSKLGFGRNYGSHDLIATGKSASLRHTFNLKERQNVYGENITFLEQIIEWCDKQNIKVTRSAFRKSCANCKRSRIL